MHSLAPEEASSESIEPVEVIPLPGLVSETSLASYRRSIEAVRRYSVRKRSPDLEDRVDVSILEAVQDLVARTDLSITTLANYRSAMLFLLRDTQDQSHHNRLAYALLESLPLDRLAAPKKPLFNKTIPEQDFRDLMDQLAGRSSRSAWAQRAQFWIQATLACGARPIEWLDCRWEDEGRNHLLIVTAKKKLQAPRFLGPGVSAPRASRQGLPDDGYADEEDDTDWQDAGAGSAEAPLRVPGAIRRIPITRHSDRLAIDAHLREMAMEVKADAEELARLEAFHRYHDQCRLRLRRACQKLWGKTKNYTLYTFRSQFQANQRAMFGAAATAALMGHASEKSPATSHYGKAAQAHTRFKGERSGALSSADIAAQIAGAGDAPEEQPLEAM